MAEAPATTESTGTPSAIQKSPLDFDDNEVQTVAEEEQVETSTVPQQIPVTTEEATTVVPPETDLEKDATIMAPPVHKGRRKRIRGKGDGNAPPKVQKTDHTFIFPDKSANEGPSTVVPDVEHSVSEPDPLSFAHPRSTPNPNVAQ